MYICSYTVCSNTRDTHHTHFENVQLIFKHGHHGGDLENTLLCSAVGKKLNDLCSLSSI